MKKIICLFLFSSLLIFMGCSSDISFESANYLAEKGDYRLAVKQYEKFASKNSNDRLAPAALFNAASIIQLEINDNKAAEAMFKKLAEQHPNTKWAAESYRRLMDMAREAGDHSAAVEYCNLGIKNATGVGSSMPPSWFQEMTEACTNSANMIEDFDLKIKTYMQLVEYLPHGRIRAATLLQLAEAFETVGKKDEAASVLKELMETYPNSEAASTAIASKRELAGDDFNWDGLNLTIESRNKFISGDYKGAIKDAEKVMEKYPESGFAEVVEFGMIVSEVHLTRNFETGMDKMRDYLDKYPNAVPKDEAETRLEIWGEILGFLDTLEEEPDNYALHGRLGRRLMNINMNKMAEEHLLIALKSPDADNVLLSLAQLYGNMGENQKTIKYLQKYLEKHPNDGGMFNNLGYTMIGQGNFEGAVECFIKYKDIEPDNPNSHDSYAECMMRMGRNNEAIAEYKRAVELDPDFSNSIFMLGEIYKNIGDKENSIKYYNMFLEKVSVGRFSEVARASVDSLNSVNM